LAAEATAGATKISAEGAAIGESVRLTKFELTQGGAMRLALTGPAVVMWRPVVVVETMHLAGPEGAVDAALTWGETGRVELAVKNFSSAWLSELGVLRGPAWRVNSLAAKGAWERGPMAFSLKGSVAVELGEGKSASVTVKAQGDAGGVKIEDLSVVEEEKSVVKVVGKIPLRVSPVAARLVEFESAGALALDVTTEANAGFWSQLAGLTGFELKEPEAAAHVTGTWARPQGTVRFKAARVSADAARFKRPMPTVEVLDVELAGDAGGVRLENFSVSVEGQAVRASGRLPVKEGKWREFLESPVAWAQGAAEAKIEVPDADVAALARFLPVFVAPKGRLQVDVNYKSGALGGSLRLKDAAMRPLGPLGVLQEINAEVAFAGRRIELRSVTARERGAAGGEREIECGGGRVEIQRGAEGGKFAVCAADGRAGARRFGFETDFAAGRGAADRGDGEVAREFIFIGRAGAAAGRGADESADSAVFCGGGGSV
jgi:translocation and assembly module TamB